MTAPGTTGSGGSAGILTAYANVIGAAATAAVAITGLTPGWYEVEATVENGSTTVGSVVQDGYNMVLESDAVTSGTYAYQRVLPCNPFIPAATTPRPSVITTRVYANSKIAIVAQAASTASTTWLCTLAVKPSAQGEL